MTEWKGYYRSLEQQQVPLEIANLQIDATSGKNGAMTASGTDNVGKYTVKGTYFAKDSECMFKKQYEGFYAV